MSTVVLVWELGGGFGHVTRLKVLADTLSQRGYAVHLIVKDTLSLLQLYPQGAVPDCHIHQAPVWPDKNLKLSREPATSAELLLSLGYYKSQKLSEQLQLWQNLLQSLQPDVVVYDYAPTAVLASRDLHCLKISLHSPFSKPPNVSPMPAFDREQKLSETNLALSEKKFIEVVNQALQERRLPFIRSAYEVFETDLSFLATIPELDLFADFRRADVYLGPLDGGHAVPPPGRAAQVRVFAYLKPDYPALEALLNELSDMDMTGNLFIPGCPANVVREYQDSELRISVEPLNMQQALSDSDLVVCHGGHSTVLQSILGGIPVLIVPLHQEQLMTARRVMDMGLGQGLGPVARDSNEIRRRINALIEFKEYRENAMHLREKYRNMTQEAALQTVVSAIEAAL